jgi:ABC-type amino acid transport substrate-binding protein
MTRCVAAGLASVLLLGAAAPVPAETVLEKISRTRVLNAGTRGSSIPFAFINEKNEWIGFSIDLLEAIRTRLEKKLGKPIKLEKKELDPGTRVQLAATGPSTWNAGPPRTLGAETRQLTSPSTSSSPAASSW